VSDIPLLLEQLRDELRQQARKLDPEGAGVADEDSTVPVAPGVVAAATQRYNLPPAYREFLAALGQRGFSILPGPFQELVIYAAPELDRAQVGFRGPRLGDDAFVAPHGWRRSWVVIAYDSGDPYFLDTTKVRPNGDSPVWTAMHGTGTWEPILAASSLTQFLQILRVWVRIVVSHHDKQNPDEPLDDAHLRRLTNEINQIDSAATDHWTI
jgi:hypothetical protein